MVQGPRLCITEGSRALQHYNTLSGRLRAGGVQSRLSERISLQGNNTESWYVIEIHSSSWEGQVNVMPWQCATSSATTAFFVWQQMPNNDCYQPVACV